MTRNDNLKVAMGSTFNCTTGTCRQFLEHSNPSKWGSFLMYTPKSSQIAFLLFLLLFFPSIGVTCKVYLMYSLLILFFLATPTPVFRMLIPGMCSVFFVISCFWLSASPAQEWNKTVEVGNRPLIWYAYATDPSVPWRVELPSSKNVPLPKLST